MKYDKKCKVVSRQQGLSVLYFFSPTSFLSILQVSTSGEQERTAKAKHGIGLTHKPGALFIQFLKGKKEQKRHYFFPPKSDAGQ